MHCTLRIAAIGAPGLVKSVRYTIAYPITFHHKARGQAAGLDAADSRSDCLEPLTQVHFEGLRQMS